MSLSLFRAVVSYAWRPVAISALLTSAAVAQVAPPAMRYLNEMSGFVALSQALGSPLRASSAPADMQVSMAYARGGPSTRSALAEAHQQLVRTGVSAEMAARLVNSNLFTGAARKYGASLGLDVSANLADALAGYLSVCRSSIKKADTTPSQAADLQLVARSQLNQRLRNYVVTGQPFDLANAAEALNVQTGLAALSIEQRKTTNVNNTELSIFCSEGTKKLGFDLEKIIVK